MTTPRLCLLLIALLVSLPGCGGEDADGWKPPQKVMPGDLYSVRTGEDDDRFAVVKVLATDDQHVHLRLYAGTYEQRPLDVDPASLTLGDLTVIERTDLDERGYAHMPVRRKEFLKWRPVLIRNSPVTADQREPYEQWQLRQQSPETDVSPDRKPPNGADDAPAAGVGTP